MRAREQSIACVITDSVGLYITFSLTFSFGKDEKGKGREGKRL